MEKTNFSKSGIPKTITLGMPIKFVTSVTISQGLPFDRFLWT